MANLRIINSEIASRTTGLSEIYANGDSRKSMGMVMLSSRCPSNYSHPGLFEQPPTTWEQGQRNSQILQSPGEEKTSSLSLGIK